MDDDLWTYRVFDARTGIERGRTPTLGVSVRWDLLDDTPDFIVLGDPEKDSVVVLWPSPNPYYTDIYIYEKLPEF